MSMASKVANAKTSGSGIYPHGRGIATILLIKENDGHKGVSFVAEMRVDSSEPTAVVDEKGVAIPPSPVGSSVSAAFNLTEGSKEKIAMMLGKAKSLLLAATGQAESECTQADFEELYDAAILPLGTKAPKPTTPEDPPEGTELGQPLRGFRIAFETYMGKNRDKKPMEFCKYSAVAQTAEQIDANRKTL